MVQYAIAKRVVVEAFLFKDFDSFVFPNIGVLLRPRLWEDDVVC